MRRFALLLATVVLVPACGGGGGGGGGAGGGPAPRVPFRKARGCNTEVEAIVSLPGGGAYLAGAFSRYDSVPAGGIVRIDATGAPDPTFDTGSGFDSPVLAIALAEDASGDVYAGGLFQSFNGTPCGSVVRLNADGSRDTAFAMTTPTMNTLSCLAPAVDGSGDVYIGGDFAGGIARLNANGTVDAAFAPGTGLNLLPYRIVTAADGSGDVYVGGPFTLYQALPASRIVRLNANGTRDNGFAIGTGFGGDVLSLLLHAPSGDLYVGGDFTTYNAAPAVRIARLNSDGSLDSGFTASCGGSVRAISFDAAGRIVIGGQFSVVNGQSSINFARLTQAGALDSAFPLPGSFSWIVLAIVPAWDASGDVFVGGQFTAFGATGCNRIARITLAGAPAPGFMTGSGFDNTVRVLEALPGAGAPIYVSGPFSLYNGAMRTRLARITADGDLDVTFAPITINGAIIALCAAGDGSGDLYVGGTFTDLNGPANRIVRLNADGSRDFAFEPAAGFNGEVSCLARAADGSGDIFAGGQFTSYRGTTVGHVARLNADGSLDTSFAPGAGADNNVRAILPATDGSGDLYAGGDFTSVSGVTSGHIVRFNPNGTVDTGFAANPGFDELVRTIAPVEGSSQIYVGGDFSTYNLGSVEVVARLNTNGTRDASFNATAPNGAIFTLATAMDGTGDVYVAGDWGLARLNANGTADGGFAIGLVPPGDIVWAIARGGPGEVYAVGSFTAYGGSVVGCIARIFADGSLDE